MTDIGEPIITNRGRPDMFLAPDTHRSTLPTYGEFDLRASEITDPQLPFFEQVIKSPMSAIDDRETALMAVRWGLATQAALYAEINQPGIVVENTLRRMADINMEHVSILHPETVAEPEPQTRRERHVDKQRRESAQQKLLGFLSHASETFHDLRDDTKDLVRKAIFGEEHPMPEPVRIAVDVFDGRKK